MRLSRRELAAGAAALLASGKALASDGAPGLHAIARRKGLDFGTAVGVGSRGDGAFDDPAYRALVAAQCGIVVHENELKLYALKGARPEGYTFGPADRLVAFARENGLKVRGHTLLWNRDDFAPKWTQGYDFGGRAGAERWLRDYVAAVAGRYADVMQSWDVVNETIDPKTGAMRDTVFTRNIGPEVVELAFHVAREAAPNAKLVYNDYMGHAKNDAAHRRGVLTLLQQMKKKGVPIDALGVQGHIANGDSDTALTFRGQEAREWRAWLDEVRGLGLDLIVTEFDVNDVAGSPDPAKRDAEVAAVAADWLDLMLDYRELKQVLAWGLGDRYSWLQTWWPRKDGLPKRPTPYDADLRPKPLRDVMARAFAAAPVRQGWA